MSTHSFDQNLGSALTLLASKVREASRVGAVVPLSEVWQGTEDEFVRYSQAGAGSTIGDIMRVRDNEQTYLYSEQYMTCSYAESAARACGKDPRYMIAETVRRDSRTYPRPTPVEAFRKPPFGLSQDALDRAVQEISNDPKYEDILLLRASDGSRFLFSSMHLDPAHAESLAEWIAVGYLQNP